MRRAERWILISNCQTTGLANSLQMLADGVEVEPLDVGEYRRDRARHDARLDGFDRVLVGRSALDVEGADFSRARRVDETPELAFAAYHPDLTYVTRADGQLLAGPLDVYHSMIGFLAHQRGRSVEQTLPLFDGAVYAASGYLDRWAPARDALVGYAGALGLEIGDAVRRWGREGAFMYSTNHPRVRVLYDLARIYLEREGYAPRVSDVLPHDNLAGGGVFPVYPEVGDALGVPGSYLFKRAFAYSQIGLRQYLEECFAVYDAHPRGALAPHAVFAHNRPGVEAALDAAGATA